MGGRLKNTCMNQHDELGFKYLLGFTTELLNLRFYPLPSPLPRGEGMMVLKPTIIGFSAICPLSPWERAKPNNLKKTSSEKMATKNTHYPNHQKKNIKNNCCQIRFRRPVPTKIKHTLSEIRFPRYLKLGDSTWASSQFLLRLRSR